MSDFPDASELLLRVRGAEHGFTERKSKSDKGGWIETAVAFANDLPIGDSGFLFVGAGDNGELQITQSEASRPLHLLLEDVSKSVDSVLGKAYPAIYYRSFPLTEGNRACLAVVVKGTEARPHFAGQAFCRVNGQSVVASAEQFEELIAKRNSKGREIMSHVGDIITCRRVGESDWRLSLWRQGGTRVLTVTLQGCNRWYVTLLLRSPFANPGDEPTKMSYPLSRVDISFDQQNQRFELEIDNG